MFRNIVLSLVLTLGSVAMVAPASAAPFFPAPVQSAYDGCWQERHFMIALRARLFANSLERRGYVVQVQRVGLLNWCVRYTALAHAR